MTTTTKDDIVRRLMLEHREHDEVFIRSRIRKALFREAADEIERLRALWEWHEPPPPQHGDSEP